jgi:energy-coupling factor transporter ATP-binding protein EcfA2
MIKENSECFFQIPIYFDKEKKEIQKELFSDVELLKNIDWDEKKGMISYFIHHQNISSKLSNKIYKQFSTYFTTNVQFLKENQFILKKFQYHKDDIEENDNMFVQWNDFKNKSLFLEKYNYISIPYFKCLNKYPLFLECLSLYHITNPLISLFVPIFIFTIPFFILLCKGYYHIGLFDYWNILKEIILNKIHLSNQTNDNTNVYVIITILFYLYSIYQNIKNSIDYHEKIIDIHSYIQKVIDFGNKTLSKMNMYYQISKQCESHKEFNNRLINKIKEWKELLNQFISFTPMNYSIHKLCNLGELFHQYHSLYNSNQIHELFEYSFGFHGYINCIQGIQENLKENKIKFCKFTNKREKCKIIDNNYPPFHNMEKVVTNDIYFKKNMLITGSNGSGKSTLLKSVLINLIFSQQWGCGYYSYANIFAFHNLHSYINIPDTSDRDSLFQSEARRCKKMIDIIQTKKNESHFCIFDELFSGTNHDESVSCSIGFIDYLIKNEKVFFLLTTHCQTICQKMNSSSLINKFMKTDKTPYGLKSTYQLKNGISETKGGIYVLKDLNYPKEIIQKCIEEIKK